MPARLEKCVTMMKSHNVSDNIAYGKCTNWMKAGRLREDGTVIPKTKQSLSFNDIERLLRETLEPKTRGISSVGIVESDYVYIKEVFPDSVIYEKNNKYFKRSYVIIDDEVILGEPIEVEEVYISKQSLDAGEVSQAIKKRKGVNPEEGTGKYGDVTYADETNKKYPIDTEAHVRAALSYINMPKNASKYSPEDLKKIKTKTRSAAKKFGITISESITVGSLEGITQVEIVALDKEKGVSVVTSLDGTVIQYIFDMLNDAEWDLETISQYIAKRNSENILQSILHGELGKTEKVSQNLDAELMARLKEVDNDPFFVPLKVKYGTGSNKQHFDKAFFDKAGAKFEGTPFLFNHSDLSEFGRAIPVGSIVKFAGAKEDGAEFIAYISAAEGTLRQKIKESQALGDKGFVRRISIEGIPSKDDFKVDEKTGIKYFHDLAMPTGIAIVNREGLKGSSIIS